MKFSFIDKHKTEFPVGKMCRIMKVSESGFYNWQVRVPSVRARRGAYLQEQVKRVHERSRKRYGSPRITAQLNSEGIKVSQPTVAKLMRVQSIRSIVRKKFKVTTQSSHRYPVVENIVSRNFNPARMNHTWVSDLTYIYTGGGWIYLTTVIDLFDRKVIGWALSETMKTCDTSVPAFRMAATNRKLSRDQQLTFHSDRGIQYACDEFVDEMKRFPKLQRSMSRKGDCWDNAVAESFFKTLKTELVYQEKYESKFQAKLAVFEYIEGWYNKHRRHKHLNNLTIEEFHGSINN
ncbi:MAG: IS3 family transposase [Bacteroidetes bacterium]|nr:IS3 family transposase [Bacteroidota bacterium]